MNIQSFAYLFVRLHGTLLIFWALYAFTEVPSYTLMVDSTDGLEPYHSSAVLDLDLFILRNTVEALLGLFLFFKSRTVVNFLMVKTKEAKAES